MVAKGPVKKNMKLGKVVVQFGGACGECWNLLPVVCSSALYHICSDLTIYGLVLERSNSPKSLQLLGY